MTQSAPVVTGEISMSQTPGNATAPAVGATAPGAEAAPGGPSSTAGGRRHHAPERGLERTPLSPLQQGKFGRMFDLAPLPVSVEMASKIADLMREQVVDAGGGWQGAPPSLDNDSIPSGYTYFGQFVDHDVTFDPASSLDRQQDPDALHNFRTPRLDLDSVYGAGPQDQPYLYEDDDERFVIQMTGNGEEDLPRNVRGRALTGDPRNDENVMVSQLHLQILKAHNRLVGELKAGAHTTARWSQRPEDAFREAQRLLRWHYQYVVATDFLWLTCGGIVQVLLDSRENDTAGLPTWEGRLRLSPPAGGRLLYQPRGTVPFMPVEFAVGAYRFGHSQPRPGYKLNDANGAQLFVEDPQGANDTRHLGGNRPLLPNWTIQWHRFLELGGSELQASRLINTKITEPLFFLGPRPADASDLASRQRQLPWRNLRRGDIVGLPSGEAVARHLGLQPTALPELRDLGIPDTPLWYYTLAEAQAQQGGRRLGEVGARIVTEVLLGVLQRDRFSFLRSEPGWKPFLGKDHSTARYGLADLVRYAQG